MTYEMAVSFKLNHADFPPLLSSTVSKLVSSVFSWLAGTTISRYFSYKVFFHLNLLLKLVINLFLVSPVFLLETLL